MKQKLSLKIQKVSESVLTVAGVYSVSKPGTRPAGVARSGKSVFVASNLANSDNTDAGVVFLHVLVMFVTPFNVLSKNDQISIERSVKIAGDKRIIRDLDIANATRNIKKFGSILIKAANSQNSNRLAAVTAFKLYDHWGVMSPAQKSIAIAAMIVQLHKTDEGGAVCDAKIINGEGQEFRVSDALRMVHAGQNPYPLVLNWAQIYRLAKVYIDKPTTESLMDFAISHKFIGKGISDAAVPNVTKDKIQEAGGKPAPQYGVGALVMPKEQLSPEGYADAVELQDSKITVPKANANTAAGALIGSLVGSKAGVNGMSTEALMAYSRWNKDDRQAVDRGADGGSTLVAALTGLKKTNRYLYSAMIAFLARYAHEEIESENASHYLASLAGIALARIVSGKSSKEADRDGILLARKVGASTPADFAKLQILLRSMYANFGITSKADAYQLSNQAYAEGRINDSDLVAMHQVYDIIYNVDAFGELERLFEGTDKGLEIVRTEGPDAENKMLEGQMKITKQVVKEMTIEEIRARNRARYAKKDAQKEAQAEQQEEMAEQQQMQQAPPEGQMQPQQQPAPAMSMGG